MCQPMTGKSSVSRFQDKQNLILPCSHEPEKSINWIIIISVPSFAIIK